MIEEFIENHPVAAIIGLAIIYIAAILYAVNM